MIVIAKKIQYNREKKFRYSWFLLRPFHYIYALVGIFGKLMVGQETQCLMNNIKLILSCKITSTFVLLFLVPLSGNLTQMRIVETILLSEVDFIKVGRRVQIIEIALSICTLRLRPTFEKLFTDVKFQRKGIRRKKSL